MVSVSEQPSPSSESAVTRLHRCGPQRTAHAQRIACGSQPTPIQRTPSPAHHEPCCLRPPSPSLRWLTVPCAALARIVPHARARTDRHAATESCPVVARRSRLPSRVRWYSVCRTPHSVQRSRAAHPPAHEAVDFLLARPRARARSRKVEAVPAPSHRLCAERSPQGSRPPLVPPRPPVP
jgi:hypothetical protein